jgi:hypothetical protein
VVSAPDAAVQVVVAELAGRGFGPELPSDFHAALDALAEAGWLHDPAEVAALRRDLMFALAANERLTATRDELFETRKRLEAEVAALRAAADALLAKLETGAYSYPERKALRAALVDMDLS